MTMLPQEKIGSLTLSVQASANHYCIPKVDGLPLDQYTHVEVRILDEAGNLVLPSAVGCSKTLDKFFEKTDAPIAPYVARYDVARIRHELESVARLGPIDPTTENMTDDELLEALATPDARERFVVTIVTENAAFDEYNKPYELARILRDIAARVESGVEYGPARDYNGNTVGDFRLTAGE